MELREAVVGFLGMDGRRAAGLAGPGGWWAVLLIACFLGGWSVPVYSSVMVTTADNETYYFADSEAAFGGIVPSEGIVGVLHVANPLKACDPLPNEGFEGDFPGDLPSFVLVERGVCAFALKVRNAQNAGFAAVVVYNDIGGRELITMSGRDTKDLYIPAVFVTNKSGHQLLTLVLEKPGCAVLILPNFENAAWSLMVVTFISLLVVAAILATFYVIRRHRLQQTGPGHLQSDGMTPGEVKALPSIVFKTGAHGKGTSETCAICLEDYENGDKLRVLPCDHEFHTACIDQWLTTRRPFCPVCKRDAHKSDDRPPVSERTPLLSDVSGAPLGGGDAIEDLVSSVPSADVSARAAESV